MDSNSFKWIKKIRFLRLKRLINLVFFAQNKRKAKPYEAYSFKITF